MNVARYGQSRSVIEIDGESFFLDPFFRQNDLARNVDVRAFRAAGPRWVDDFVADAVGRAGCPGAAVTADRRGAVGILSVA